MSCSCCIVTLGKLPGVVICMIHVQRGRQRLRLLGMPSLSSPALRLPAACAAVTSGEVGQGRSFGNGLPLLGRLQLAASSGSFHRKHSAMSHYCCSQGCARPSTRKLGQTTLLSLNCCKSCDPSPFCPVWTHVVSQVDSIQEMHSPHLLDESGGWLFSSK